VDIDSSENLIAYQHTMEEIVEIVGADSIGFLPVEDLPRLCGEMGLCSACFTGDYPVEPPKAGSKSKFESKFQSKA
jgi:amidophosphoribosyltransferase